MFIPMTRMMVVQISYTEINSLVFWEKNEFSSVHPENNWVFTSVLYTGDTAENKKDKSLPL